MKFESKMQAMLEEDVQERLTRFLSWLLDARWFPERDNAEKQSAKANLQVFQRIIRRMESFNRKHRDERLRRGLAEWRHYGQTAARLAKTSVRRAPHVKISGGGAAEIEITQRLLCATLIISRLWPDVSVYAKMQKLLAEPASLPNLITAAEDSAKELRTLNGQRLCTASEIEVMRTGKDIPLRVYSKTEKALQSSVARVKRKIEAGQYLDKYTILQNLYAQYLWSQWGQAGFSEAEAEMLRSLIPVEAPGNAG